MNKQIEFQHYFAFIKETYPQSAFLKSEEGLIKKLFINIHDSLIISEIFSSIKSLNPVCTQLLTDQKLIYLKILYILPTNDDFQFYSIMRANVENLLRILLSAFKPEMTYQDIKTTKFSTLNDLLDATYLNQKYKVELSELYSYFGTFSKKIHKISNEQNTILYLKEMMSKTLDGKSLRSKITSMEKIKGILINVFLDIYKIKSSSFDTPQLVRLHSILGEEEYEKLPLFKK
ncbi:hypothetical protein COM04_03180 [Bacillus wiedmannii]|uniref:hypothetical protein n=1 Tax=Bacillus wiedmannii TaxID=1890302 RepID=UPI000BF00F96|nr:hypothetical protein [Bacillus wiedmannii]MCP9277015.1 hypothetical protein [Bacillus wiedmannii]PEO96991.1 hypothetical protein CN554_14530 [Bacillus wiedmannii]PEP75639.1 hypothetical protein CN573_09670 [Bacillus wiedmannii]PGC00354.1 hypothetical protein COM04_03180 [Bacillus wiedmannii]HDR7866549.1 hypothetical protein [Bacillus wiedmannii]